MLRLGEGWSAEKLSQEYRTGGGGELARATIAKIERDMRPIKVDEVDGVARVFGLTPNDLLDPDGPKVFLSYAEPDGPIADKIAAWLGEHGFQLLSARPTADNLRSGLVDAPAIDAAQAFVVLLSQSFLSSPRCQLELDLAVRREMQLLTARPDAHFIYVLQVTAEVDLDDSGLSAHLLIDLPAGDGRSRDMALNKLGGSILYGARATGDRADPPIPVTTGQKIPGNREILARDEELGRVLNALTKSPGASFLLVIGPPGFGKSWLLGQLEAKAAKQELGDWVTKMVDLRPAEPAEPARPQGAAGGGRLDAMTVISSLFAMDLPQPDETDDAFVRRAAHNVMAGVRSRLFILDSAELLSADAVRQLRQYLDRIYRRVQNSGRGDVSLTFVAASRRDDGWRGIMPPPEPSVLQLGGVGPGVVQEALEGQAGEIDVVRSPAELRRDAEFVHGVTEGMPEPVLESLQWIRDEQWLDIQRLADDPEVFKQTVERFVERRLLSPDSLLPAAGGPPARSAKQLAALREGIRVLVPYRLITLSHVKYQLGDDVDSDRRLRDALKEADWEDTDLWQAITRTALLLPLQDPWREIHPAVRRLLFRHLYRRPDERAAAHDVAAAFAKRLASRLRDRDQIAGLVEAIWHEAVTLRLAEEEMGRKLVASARALSANVRDSEAFSKAELRNYAVQRMSNDAELQREVANVKDLFDRLIEAVRDPGDQHV